jgi:hypothetical protein
MSEKSPRDRINGPGVWSHLYRRRDVMKRTAASGAVYSTSGWGVQGYKAPSITQLCRDLPPMVYFIRTPEGPIKIGTSSGWLHGRMNARHAQWTDILAITPGSYDEEAAWHERFAEHALGHELFEPHEDILAAINEIRDRLGVGALSSF